MPQKLEIQPSPTDRVLEYEQYHEEQGNRRLLASAYLRGTANYIRYHSLEKLSPADKDRLLRDIVRYADEFLEGR